jgi:AcrR family transcriptional regulator
MEMLAPIGHGKVVRYSLMTMNDRPDRKDDSILAVVVGLLETDGYDAVQMRTVAERGRVSLKTVYKYFPTRDDLIMSAIERWMDDNAYAVLGDPPATFSLYDALMWSLRQVFDPWERHPRMLEAFHRARQTPGGERLHDQGFAAVAPIAKRLLARVDDRYADDLELLLPLVVQATIAEFAAGDLASRDILRVLERAVFRLTADNTAAAVARLQTGRRNRREGRKGVVASPNASRGDQPSRPQRR